MTTTSTTTWSRTNKYTPRPYTDPHKLEKMINESQFARIKNKKMHLHTHIRTFIENRNAICVIHYSADVNRIETVKMVERKQNCNTKFSTHTFLRTFVIQMGKLLFYLRFVCRLSPIFFYVLVSYYWYFLCCIFGFCVIFISISIFLLFV